MSVDIAFLIPVALIGLFVVIAIVVVVVGASKSE